MTTEDNRRHPAEQTLQLPVIDPSAGRGSATSGAKPIFFRFILVVVSINALFGLGLIVFDIRDSIKQVREHLIDRGKDVLGICDRLRALRPDLEPGASIDQCATLTGSPLALLDQTGKIVHQTNKELGRRLASVFGGTVPSSGQVVEIDRALGDLSGAWLVRPFHEHRLVMVIRRAPEDLGYFEYMTIGAGVLALGLALSIAVMLGTARWVLYQPVQRLVDRLTGALAKDIERRRSAEEKAIAARFEAEEHLTFRDNLLDAAKAVGIIATDSGGVIRIFNRAAERILGYAESEVRGVLTIDELRAMSSRPAEADKEVPLRSLIQLAPGEEFRTSKNGGERLLAINRGDILDGTGQSTGRLVTFVDITEQKRLEAELKLSELQLIQSAKMASLGEMATGVAHELNQPLNNIGLLTSRVLRRLPRFEDGPDRGFVAEKLERVQGQVERAGRIIEQMRAFGRRTDETTLFSVEVAAPVGHVEEMLSEQLRSEGVTLEVELARDLPAVLGDAGQLEQVLLNLIANARDAFDDGTKQAGWKRPDQRLIRVAGRVAAGDPSRVELTVADNGPGMTDEVRARAFQPFYTTKEVGRGTGLGLAISYSLIRGFGGTLAIESKLNEGSTFKITLRQVAASEDFEAEDSEADDSEGQDPARR